MSKDVVRIAREFMELKQKVEQSEKAVAASQGELTGIEKSMKREFKVDSIEAAKKQLSKLDKTIVKLVNDAAVLWDELSEYDVYLQDDFCL